jgi:chorismate dehydratase
VSDRIRLGIVEYVNSRPLAWAFLQGQHAQLFQTEYLAPAKVADEMAAGRLDAGLLPTAELARIPNLRVVPGLCIAAEHEVNSVLLLSRVPPEEIRSLALDAKSRTSAVLVRILLGERWRVEPALTTAPASVDDPLGDHDAALVIGDAALKVDRTGLHVVDLAAEWRRLTGLPFVFAVWAVRDDVENPALPFYFHQSLRYGLASLPLVVRQSSRDLGLSEAETHAYFTGNLKYTLGEPEERSMEEFFRRARRLALLPEGKGVEFLDLEMVG